MEELTKSQIRHRKLLNDADLGRSLSGKVEHLESMVCSMHIAISHMQRGSKLESFEVRWLNKDRDWRLLKQEELRLSI